MKRKKLYADGILITLESGEWVAHFTQGGKVMWTARPKEPCAALGKAFKISNVRCTVEVKV